MQRGFRWAASRLALIVFSTVLGCAIVEVGLAALGHAPEWRYASTWALDDLECRYKPKPGVYPDLFDCPVRINRYGTRGPEPRRPRVLGLGDSCTFGIGLPEEKTYPGQLSARGIETINAGVPGFNSFNGLRYLRDSPLLSLRPALAVIYFGWNDHWRGLATERAFSHLREWARYSRGAALLLKLQSGSWSTDPRWRRLRWVAQVPLEEFKDNLREMVAVARRSGAAVVLIAGPSEPRLLSEADDFFQSHSLSEFEDHARYAQAVRDVAAETGAGLVDLDRDLQRRSTRNPREYFLDFAHLNAKGNRVLADLLVPWVRSAQRGLR